MSNVFCVSVAAHPIRIRAMFGNVFINVFESLDSCSVFTGMWRCSRRCRRRNNDDDDDGLEFHHHHHCHVHMLVSVVGVVFDILGGSLQRQHLLRITIIFPM